VEDLFADRTEPERPDRPLTVSELVGGVRELLEEELGGVKVVGEISSLFRARSGHCYFTLKDSGAQIKAAMFRGTAARIPFDPEDGLEVIVQAEVTVYPERGDLQIIVRNLEPVGQGALQLAFEQLKERLEAEGLFDPELKRALPKLPRRIGIVTSPAGAAIHDVIHVSGTRWPGVPLLISPTRVQGDRAEEEIAHALAQVQSAPDVDVVLVVRGGGSLEDLWAFNSERVARAIRACPVPVVSGVGHEVDFTIADFAADARAPTPSAAAMMVLPDGQAARDQLNHARERSSRALEGQLGEARSRLATTLAELRSQAPAARVAADRERFVAARRSLGRALAEAVPERRETLGRARQRIGRNMTRWLEPLGAARGRLDQRLARAGDRLSGDARARLAEAAARLDALSPLAVLSRGFAIARGADGRVLRSADEVAPDDLVQIRLGRGEIAARVTESGPARDPSVGEDGA
jgi:exodeoxyribonuclease VII large subunit